MRTANENPQIPASWQADGIQGADARSNGRCGAQHSPREIAALLLALVALDAAQTQLDAYAQATDDPHPAKAADLLDAARAALGGA